MRLNKVTDYPSGEYIHTHRFTHRLIKEAMNTNKQQLTNIDPSN